MTAQPTATSNEARYPIDNRTYDLISTLHTKLEGLAAYQKYLQDAQGDPEYRQLFEQLYEQDSQQAQAVLRHLRQRLTQEGRP